MNFKGNPILGDRSYGKSKKKFKEINPDIEKEINNFNRQALHAKSLGFIHPKTKKEIFFLYLDSQALTNLEASQSPSR